MKKKIVMMPLMVPDHEYCWKVLEEPGNCCPQFDSLNSECTVGFYINELGKKGPKKPPECLALDNA